MFLHILLLLLLLTKAHGVEAEVLVTITPKSLAHVFRKEMSMLHESLLHLKPAPFKGTYLGLEVTVDHLQVVELKMPRLTYETTSSPSQLTFKMLGGSTRLLGQYSAVYKTKREGQFEMLLEHFHLSIPVHRTGVTKFTPNPTQCSLDIDESLISLSPVLPEQITSKVKQEFLAQLQQAVCSKAVGFFDEINGKLAHFAEAMDISQGNHPSHIDVDVQLEGQKIQEDSDSENSIHVALTESVLNAELGKLFNVANTRLIWNEVPEIKELLKACDASECRAIEDGDITSSLLSKPSIKIQDSSVALELPLLTTLSSGRKEHFSIRTNAELELTDIVVESPEDGFISWNAKFKVKRVVVLQTSSSRAFQKFASKMEDWVQANKEFIENLLSSYLRGTLPVHLRSPLSWSHRLHAIPDASTSSLNFHVHPHFSPALRVNF